MNKYSTHFICILTFVFSLVVSGCLTPKYTKHYKSAADSSVALGSLPSIQADDTDASVSAFVRAPLSTPTVATTVTSLSDRGQAQFIRELSKKTEKVDDLLKALAKPIATPKTRSGVRTHDVLRKRVVLSVIHSPKYPAHRLSQVSAKLKLKDSAEAKFSGWDQYETKYEKIDLGSLSFNQGLELGVESSFDIAKNISEITALSASAKNTKSLSETLELSRRYVKSAGVLTDDMVRIYQEGVAGIDLTGNTAFDVSIQLKNVATTVTHRFSGLFTNGAHSAQDAVVVGKVPHRYSSIISSDGVLANLSVNLIQRYVKSGAETIVEADDIIEYRNKNIATSDIVLLEARDAVFAVWQLIDDQDEFLALDAMTAGSNKETLQFESKAAAQEFLLWLDLSNEVKVRNRNLFVGTNTYQATDAASLRIIRTELTQLN